VTDPEQGLQTDDFHITLRHSPHDPPGGHRLFLTTAYPTHADARQHMDDLRHRRPTWPEMQIWRCRTQWSPVEPSDTDPDDDELNLGKIVADHYMATTDPTCAEGMTLWPAAERDAAIARILDQHLLTLLAEVTVLRNRPAARHAADTSTPETS